MPRYQFSIARFIAVLEHALWTAACASIAVGVVGAQSSSTPPAAKKGASLTTLSGCVATNPERKKDFTLADDQQGETYLLKGLDVRDFVGKRVELTGSTSKRLVIVGGLYPSPNIAAQAGAIDPTKAAIAAQSGPTANAPRPQIEFRVKSVRTVPGPCPES